MGRRRTLKARRKEEKPGAKETRAARMQEVESPIFSTTWISTGRIVPVAQTPNPESQKDAASALPSTTRTLASLEPVATRHMSARSSWRGTERWSSAASFIHFAKIMVTDADTQSRPWRRIKGQGAFNILFRLDPKWTFSHLPLGQGPQT